MRSLHLFSRISLLSIAAIVALPALRASAQQPGVTLFRDRRLSGPAMTFYDDVPDLRYTQFGSRRASSIGVPEGCTAVLYDQPFYRGRSTVFREDDNDLSNTAVGEDTAASLRVNCRGNYPHWHSQWDRRDDEGDGDRDRDRDRTRRPHGWREGGRGVTLYRDREARGPAAFFDRDIPNLDETPFGSRMASSIDVTPGCVAVLYELPGYRGRRTEFRQRDNNLKNTAVGEDTVSSLQVRCR